MSYTLAMTNEPVLYLDYDGVLHPASRNARSTAGTLLLKSEGSSIGLRWMTTLTAGQSTSCTVWWRPLTDYLDLLNQELQTSWSKSNAGSAPDERAQRQIGQRHDSLF